MRRQFGGRNLGHLYVYSETWPGTAAAAASAEQAPPAQDGAAMERPAAVPAGSTGPLQPETVQEAPSAARRPLPLPVVPDSKL
jgi:hypothetical protein